MTAQYAYVLQVYIFTC